jgi:hypothetical protein
MEITLLDIGVMPAQAGIHDTLPSSVLGVHREHCISVLSCIHDAELRGSSAVGAGMSGDGIGKGEELGHGR